MDEKQAFPLTRTLKLALRNVSSNIHFGTLFLGVLYSLNLILVHSVLLHRQQPENVLFGLPWFSKETYIRQKNKIKTKLLLEGSFAVQVAQF